MPPWPCEIWADVLYRSSSPESQAGEAETEKEELLALLDYFDAFNGSPGEKMPAPLLAVVKMAVERGTPIEVKRDFSRLRKTYFNILLNIVTSVSNNSGGMTSTEGMSLEDFVRIIQTGAERTFRLDGSKLTKRNLEFINPSPASSSDGSYMSVDPRSSRPSMSIDPPSRQVETPNPDQENTVPTERNLREAFDQADTPGPMTQLANRMAHIRMRDPD